jgi:hypothetical protein
MSRRLRQLCRSERFLRPLRGLQLRREPILGHHYSPRHAGPRQIPLGRPMRRR